MIVGYEFGHRFPEWQRAQIKFARTEQFQQWFIASAPGNPVLLRCLELIRQRYTWKVESTLELTGPGVFSDAVHEFLEMKSPHAVENEVKVRRHPPDVHFLSYPSCWVPMAASARRFGGHQSQTWSKKLDFTMTKCD
ncbi:unnamed protein product [Cladocopium goreaui]|uniref:Initiation-specific alpha-1,6-mannosyltransferase n=1 Tax=Cladocopium goreaui TaxID=2562237 RepID=A0A9P1GR92_9DINO|nr:unnamed protein product [Cladocopium goreaui]